MRSRIDYRFFRFWIRILPVSAFIALIVSVGILLIFNLQLPS